MYKLLVVDDEYNIRNGIVNAVPWDICNVVVAGEAANGIEALEKVEETLPDIVITDINMNDMDGLEFAENLKQKYPHIKVIILSGYDEFEYAKRALQLKVFSYLLKPILPDELIKVVKEVIEEIKAEARLKEKVFTLESEIKINREVLIEKLMSDLVNGNITERSELQAIRGVHLSYPKDKENAVFGSLNEDIVMGCVNEYRSDRYNNVKSVIAKAQKYIKANFTSPDISLNSIAEHVYLNPAYFSKLYKKETGETYMEFLTRLRMEKAKSFLKETNIRTSDIGAAVGYPNSQYFTTLFKKVTGKTPLEYRERK